MHVSKAAASSGGETEKGRRNERKKSLKGGGGGRARGGEVEKMRKKGARGQNGKTEKEEREETLSLGITITEQVKRDKCQRTLGEIKQQLACTHPGKHKSATVRESPGLWSKQTRRGGAEGEKKIHTSPCKGESKKYRAERYGPTVFNISNSIG